MRPEIKEGTIVKFFFANRPPLSGELIWKPQATGDSWIINGPQGMGHIYIQQFQYMFAPQQALEQP